MAWIATAIGGGAVVAGVTSYLNGQSQQKAAEDAADAQAKAAEDSLAFQKQVYSDQQTNFQPYIAAGNNALSQYGNLSGANGNAAQQAAYNAITNSSGYQSQLQQANTNLLQNAAATGGLRGGNTQTYLTQLAPQLLQQNVNNQLSSLGNLMQQGQASVAGQAAAGQNAASGVAGINQQLGNANAASAYAAAQNPLVGALGSAAGFGLSALGGFV